MLNRIFIFACAVVFILSVGILLANAQQQPPMTPHEQALVNRLTAEINNSLTCSGALIAAQQQLQKANAEIAELKKKAGADDKKPDAAKKP